MVGRLLLCFWFASLTATVRMALQEKYTIVNKSNQLIHLSCDASSDQLRAGIHWRLDGVPLAKNARNNILDLEVTDRPDAGKYSCHLNNTTELLKHYYVLIDEGSQADKILKEDNGNYITCQVEKFGGNFTCFWSMKENATFSASFHREGWKGVSNDCVLTLRKSSERDVQATCIDQTFSPYAEEFRQITFTVEAATSKRYEKHTKHFYIRDILKPTAPVNLTTQHVVKERKFNVTWQYPISWNHPHSYFPLLFKVDIKLTSRKGKHERQTGNVDTSAESLIPCNAAAIRQLKRHQTVSCYTESPSVEFSYKRKLFHKVGRVCVQVKELYFKSTWSQPSCTDH